MKREEIEAKRENGGVGPGLLDTIRKFDRLTDLLDLTGDDPLKVALRAGRELSRVARAAVTSWNTAGETDAEDAQVGPTEPAPVPKSLDPLEWCRFLIRGVGGFEDFERYEAAVFKDRDVSLAYFVVRALANPRCEDSERMLEAIRQRRAEFLAKAEPTLKAGDFEP